MTPSLPWLDPEEAFPPVSQSWDSESPAPGLLAAGATLDVWRLKAAYANGIFPWFSQGQPILWWSPDPRMVLHVDEFKVHRSLRRTLQKFRQLPSCEVRIDSNFGAVIRHCSQTARSGQSGTWIVPAMIEAYEHLHEAGNAHSVETWVDGQLVGGLYCISIGRAVFGESMFAHATDASKVALAALVGLCRTQGVSMIDCQQNTGHLASLGAREISRARFLESVSRARTEDALDWSFKPVYWDSLLPPLKFA
ncbi:MAG: leucyl/phenylalanyl-tRNA--protein transferase [Burkholderiaceae bacterium]|jgi:leucyl/phenylalanyl-tRNA--protein transferase|nr:leucyl/phenylalanyl-tRNA--protein transferase [Burkholderiaceae bacterium]